jgi:molybdopterin-guanine dinucleotide biosynthesis protein A
VTARIPAATGLVLAGGRSSRFGRDKLRERIGDATLLERAVAAVASTVDEVIILGPAGETAGIGASRGVPIRVAPDRQPWAGPLVAVADALRLVRGPLAIVVGGDMPTLVPAVLGTLLETVAQDERVDAAALLLRDRRLPLPAALRVAAAMPRARELVDDGQRSLRSLLDGLRTRDVEERAWRPLDPDAATVHDVDRLEDLPG